MYTLQIRWLPPIKFDFQIGCLKNKEKTFRVPSSLFQFPSISRYMKILSFDSIPKVRKVCMCITKKFGLAFFAVTTPSSIIRYVYIYICMYVFQSCPFQYNNCLTFVYFRKSIDVRCMYGHRFISESITKLRRIRNILSNIGQRVSK